MKKIDIVDLLSQLIEIPSYVGEGANENQLVEFIERWLTENTSFELERQPLPEGRFNLIARKGQPDRLLLAHTDTVPPSQNSPFDQLAATVKDGELWGRGATDMKSGIAAIMLALASVPEANNVWSVFYADEEYDFLGMKEFVAKFGAIRPKLIVSADGSDLQIGYGCRGLIEMTFRVRGQSGHPAKGTGNSAVLGMSQCLLELREYLANQVSEMGPSAFNAAYVLGGSQQEGSLKDGKLIRVGNQGNVVPDICEAKIDIRPSSEAVNVEAVIARLKPVCQGLGLRFELVSVSQELGSWYTSPDSLQPFVDLAGRKTAKPTDTGYLDLQMLWEKVGRPPAFTFGGGLGNTAHTPKERIPIANLQKEATFFTELLRLPAAA